VLPVTTPTTTLPVSVSVTVTYAANTQVVNVVFKDKDDSNKVVPPADGFRARLTGLSGSPVGFTEARAGEGVPTGYVLDSVANVTNYDYDDSVDQVITVYLTHDVRVSSLTTTRTITYTGAGTLTPPVVVQSVTWTVTTDLATRITVYTTTAGEYPVLASPVLNGYTPDKARVDALPVAAETLVEPVSVSETVTYVQIIVHTGGTTPGSPASPALLWLGLLTVAAGVVVTGFTRRRLVS